jgi:hypothetical protein
MVEGELNNESEKEAEKVRVEWDNLLAGMPEILQEELRDERPNPIMEDVEYFKALQLADKEPISITLKELIERNADCIFRCPPDVIEDINKKWGTNFDVAKSVVYDQNPGRFRVYSQIPAETAQPSMLVNGEIIFGSGRFIAALLRGDTDLKVWVLNNKDKK